VRRLFLLSFLPMLLGGCATLESKSPEQAVAERSRQRIGALMARNYEAAYAFATPGYRSTEGVIKYTSRWAGVGMWRTADIYSVSCEPSVVIDRCKVWLEVDYQAPGFEPVTTAIDEDWLLIDGEWYLYQKIGE
jgi:hypothetical protein